MLEVLIQSCRFLVGVNFLIFGINGFVPFLPVPRQTAKMKNAIELIQKLKFVMPTVKVIEVLAGAALLFNFLPDLALLILIPVVFGVLCLQTLFNGKLGIGITALTVIPFLVLLQFRAQEWFDFFLSQKF